MASNPKGLLNSAISRVRRMFTRTPKVAPRKPVGMGHRGIAAGDLKQRQRKQEAGEAPYTPEEVGKWRTLPANITEAFVYEGELLPVHSSNVAAAQYHLADSKMMVEFLDNSAYLYSNVTLDEAIQFATAQSKGSWVWDVLRVRGSKTDHKKPFVKLR